MIAPRSPAIRSPHASRVEGAVLRQPPTSPLHLIWSERWIGAIVAAGVAVLAGLLVALVMPRGPVTANQALALMATGFAAGVLAGLALRSRWAMLLAPIANVAAFELGRRGSDGPTVDGIHLDTTYGILIFILGRGLYGLLGLLPLALGVTDGAALARRANRRSVASGRRCGGFYFRHAGSGLTTIGLVALAVLIARPASVPPLRGADGEPLSGSIAELTSVRLGGHDQWLEIRGANSDNPVLLWLDGGPGQSGLAHVRVFLEELTTDFVIVAWDQRGAGKSYPAFDPTETWTLEQAVADTIALTNYLRERFDEEKIYLAGGSWGSTLGVLAVQRHPELYHAWIGSGQMVNQLETDRRIYRDLLAHAAETGDDGLARKLRAYGEPPYDDVLAYAFVMEQYDKLVPEHDAPAGAEDRAREIGPWGVLGSEYDLIDKTNVLRGLADMFAVMYPQLQELDFRRDVPRLDVPVYVLLGEYELSARADLAREWFAALQAPEKQLFTIADAGHGAAFEGFAEFDRIMTEIVLPATFPRP